jgi:hypothetical protein
VSSRAAMWVVALCLAACLCTSCGPRMITQAADKPYKSRMPDIPVGTVPTTGRAATFEQAQSALKASPLPVSPNTLDDGRVYYGYYCLMCHGENGDGNGPVGQSYVPKPTDLSSPTVARLTDAQLYSRMLHGEGHDPVMSQTVQTEHRWPLVLYVRKLQKRL